MAAVQRRAAEPPSPENVDSARFVNVDPAACIHCARCEDICPTGAITSTVPGTPWATHHIPNPGACVNCGQCLLNCPGSAIRDNVSCVDMVNAKLRDPATVTVAMPAPSIRYTLGQAFGDSAAGFAGGRMNAALHKLGFDKVWDVEFGADVTIMEEAAELLGRVSGSLKRPLPQLTSCCPGWVRYIETYHPSLIPNLSSARSPAQMLGALAKTLGAQKAGADPAALFTVQIMPCIAKKYEGLRPENARSGFRDVDATIDTREFIAMLKAAGVDPRALAEEGGDEPFTLSSGAATIFCATGGVMEAMLRRVVEALDNKPLQKVEFADVRGTTGVREATVTAGGKTLRVAVVSGLLSAGKLISQIKAGSSPYAAMEVMCCPGGCVNGGGQPFVPPVS